MFCLYGLDLLILGISYKWNHTICSHWWLTSFTWCNVFKVRNVVACISTSFLFMAELYSVVWLCHILLIWSSVGKHMGCLQFLALTKFLYRYMFSFLLCIYLGNWGAWWSIVRAWGCKRVRCDLLTKQQLVDHGELPRWCSGKESAYQCRRRKKCESSSWVGKISWNRK